MMKLQDGLLKAMAKKIKRWNAAEIVSVHSGLTPGDLMPHSNRKMRALRPHCKRPLSNICCR